MDVRTYILDNDLDGDVVLLEPAYFDQAIIGLTSRVGGALWVVNYDSAKCVQLLMENEGLDEDEAIDHFEYNVMGGWYGEKTPYFTEVLNENVL